jgi:hypothetical protein
MPVSRAQVLGAAAGMIDSTVQGLTGQVFQAAFEVTSEHGHDDASNIDVAHTRLP